MSRQEIRNQYREAVSSLNEGIHKSNQTVIDPKVSLQLLKDGNKRYVTNQTIQRGANEADRNILAIGQKPFAVILTCSDSRVSPEIFFDQKSGDIFVIRNAGGIADTTALGSIEYAVEHLKVPLVCVVGHSKCGAVTAAFHGGGHSIHLQTILETIRSGIVRSESADDAIYENISSVIEKIMRNIVIKENQTAAVGAYYDIETGIVS